jgi:prevent-host-death family protein
VARYKRYGDMLVIEPPRKAVEAVPVGDLSRSTSAVLGRVLAGGRAIITKHGKPVAVLMEVDEAIGLCGTKLLSRGEAEGRLFGAELEPDFRRRALRRAPRLLGGD